jgi:hypothetical protein
MKAAFVLTCVVLAVVALGMAQKSEPTGPSKWQTMIADDFKDGISINVFNLDGKYITPPAGGGSLTPRLTISCSRRKLGGANIDLRTPIHYAKSPAGSGPNNLKGTPRIRFGMLWDDKKTPDEDWGEVMNDGQGIYLDQNQTLKLLTGHSGALRGTPHGFVDRQSISVVDASGNRIVMQFDIPKDSAGLESDCGLEGWITSH